jgi:hypothetical protein
VVGRDPKQPRFVGDMPHGWVASDFVRAALDLFIYEREGDQALVLAAGVRPEWLEGAGVSVTNVRTPYGPVNYSLRRQGRDLVFEVADSAQVPPGGFVLLWPDGGSPTGSTRVNGEAAQWHGGELRVHALPAKVVVGPE